MLTEQIAISLTGAEAEAVEWALEVMEEYWCTKDGAELRGDTTIYNENQLPKMKGARVLILSPFEEINGDIQFRCCIQLPSMTIGLEGELTNQKIKGVKRIAESLSRKFQRAGVQLWNGELQR